MRSMYILFIDELSILKTNSKSLGKMFFYTFYNCKLQRSAAVQLIDFQKHSYVMVTKNYIIISPAKKNQ